VVHVQEQPLAIWYAWQGTKAPVEIKILDGPPPSPRKRQKDAGTSYIVPDFLVEMTDGRRRLVEVKASRRLARPIVQRKLAVGRAFAASQGWTFHLVTERELIGGPLLDNVRLMNRYRIDRMDPRLLEQLVLQVPAGGIQLGRLLAGDEAAQRVQVKVHVLHLLAVRRFSFDPRVRPLDDQTVIFPGGAILWDPFESPWGQSGSSTGNGGGSSVNWPQNVSSPKTSNAR